MALIVYEPGTGTIVGLDDSVIIELPDGCNTLEDMEAYCEQKLPTEKRMVEVDYAPATT